MNKHIFLTGDNAQEVMSDAIEAFRRKVRQEARSEGFEDCSKYWRNLVDDILDTSKSDAEKLELIRHMFHIISEDVKSK